MQITYSYYIYRRKDDSGKSRISRRHRSESPDRRQRRRRPESPSAPVAADESLPADDDKAQGHSPAITVRDDLNLDINEAKYDDEEGDSGRHDHHRRRQDTFYSDDEMMMRESGGGGDVSPAAPRAHVKERLGPVDLSAADDEDYVAQRELDHGDVGGGGMELMEPGKKHVHERLGVKGPRSKKKRASLKNLKMLQV